VTRYSFDGDANYVSGNGNDGTTAGSPVYVTGQIGQAIDLDGSDDVLGSNDYTEAEAFYVGRNFVAIAAGEDHNLAIRRYVCQYVLAGDLNDDCKVDFYDFAKMAENWLIDCDQTPENPACIPK
jgi:hypothetical protein